MPYHGGMLIANPVPQEFALEYNLIEDHINTALQEAKKNNIHGKDITPFMLQYIREKTNRKTDQSNIELIKNNAALACDIAKEYLTLSQQDR